MGWLAEWAARAYAQPYTMFGTKPFEFADARTALRSTQPRISRLIQELEREGFLFKTRQAIDRRKRLYHLVTPEQAVHALGLLTMRDGGIDSRLRAARGSAPYALTGSAAAFKYHRYSHSAITEIRVLKRDLGFWVAFLRGPGTQLSIDGYATEGGRTRINLLANLTEEAEARAVEVDGISIESREDLLGSLLRGGRDANILDAVGLMLTSVGELDWDRLARSDVRQEVGFLMAAVNLSAEKQVFEEAVLDRLRGENGLWKQIGDGSRQDELRSELASLANQWQLELRMSPRTIEKAVEDLVK